MGRQQARRYRGPGKKNRCRTGKRRFRDRTEAAVALKRAHGWGRDETRSYQCPFCNGFHLTSQKAERDVR